MISGHDELVESIVTLITEVTVEKLQSQDIMLDTEEEYLEEFLQVDSSELEEIVWFLTELLPEKIYLDTNAAMHEYLQSHLTQELILFLHQENTSSHYFKLYLENFRDELLDEILNKTYLT